MDVLDQPPVVGIFKVLTLGAGAVFGLIRGTLIVSVASTRAATAAFLVGRYLARAAVARKIEGNEKFAADT